MITVLEQSCFLHRCKVSFGIESSQLHWKSIKGTSDWAIAGKQPRFIAISGMDYGETRHRHGG
ncbi:hypothetical protein [Pseudomonas fluorescens]|uniref:hypothetical protein n=1 Tax=Pseudomonas TaxID=286 RepID=UPI003D08D1CB